MIHEMKLQPKYFNFILNGTKRIELRLNDEKRKLIKLGDTIKFQNIDNIHYVITTKVIGLLKYPSFKELLADFDVSILADSSITKLELLNILQEFYSIDKQLENGVLGIKIQII